MDFDARRDHGGAPGRARRYSHGTAPSNPEPPSRGLVSRPVTKQIRLDGVIPGTLSGLRTDQALARIFPQHSRARIQEWIRAGAATLDGVAVRAKDRVVGGERISILCDVASDDQSTAQPGPLAVLYDDPDLLVLDKPPGLVVHPGAGNRDGTLLNRLLAHDSGLRTVPRAGLVHRLDKDTSGVMLIARSLSAHTRLVAQIKAREVERVYEAVVTGSPPARATVEAPIGRDRARRTRMAVEARGKPAITHYRVVERFRRHARLEVLLETGRTHQIRVHLAHIGHPIVGDSTYGKRQPHTRATDVPDAVSMFPRQALHARRLSLSHPVSGHSLNVESELAPDMQGLVEALRAEAADSR